MKKKEILDQLITKGFKSEELENLSLKELKAMLDQEIVGDQSLCSIREVSPEENGLPLPEAVFDLITDKNVEDCKPMEKPLINDKEWTQYVMSLFDDDELEGDSPRLEGLRRVTGQLLGQILEEGCELVMSPNQDNGFRACAKAWIVINNGFGQSVRFEALADACPENCTGEFVIYPTAIADTRAKARCYRNALRLKRVLAAEEKCGDISISITNPDNIHAGQISAITLLSGRHNIDPIKLANELFPGKDIKSIKVLNFNEAQSVLRKLNELRANK